MKRLCTAILAAFAVLSGGVPVVVSIKGLHNTNTQSSATVQKISSVKLSSTNKELNGISFVFNTKRNFVHSSSSTFLQGRVRIRGKTSPASAIRHNNTITINFLGRSVNSRRRMNTIEVDENGVGHLARTPASLAERTTCGAKHEEHTHSKQVAGFAQGMQPETSMYVTIHTYADQQLYQKYGERTNDKILSFLNDAETIYATQLGVRFSVVGQTILSNKTDITEARNLLNEFRTHPETQSRDASLNHLFTGKSMDGVTIGISYVGALCMAPAYAYGVSEDYYNLTAKVLAHELGHNFGANHVTAYNTIMYPSISPLATQFSDGSVNEINLFLNAFGSCLTVQPYKPDLKRAKLTIHKTPKGVKGSLLDNGGFAVVNETIILNINKRVYRLTTDDTGTYVKRFLPRKGIKYIVYATTELGETSSPALRIRGR